MTSKVLHIGYVDEIVRDWDNGTGSRVMCGRTVTRTEYEYNKGIDTLPTCKTCERIAGFVPKRMSSDKIRKLLEDRPVPAWYITGQTQNWDVTYKFDAEQDKP